MSQPHEIEADLPELPILPEEITATGATDNRLEALMLELDAEEVRLQRTQDTAPSTVFEPGAEHHGLVIEWPCGKRVHKLAVWVNVEEDITLAAVQLLRGEDAREVTHLLDDDTAEELRTRAEDEYFRQRGGRTPWWQLDDANLEDAA